MKNINYLIIRVIAAIIDLFVFALLAKLTEQFFGKKHIDGNYYMESYIAILLFYFTYCLQDVFLKKTIGKHIMKLNIVSIESEDKNRIVRLIFRRIFDLLEIICPFVYILSILLTKKNQKLGDLITKMIVKKEDFL